MTTQDTIATTIEAPSEAKVAPKAARTSRRATRAVKVVAKAAPKAKASALSKADRVRALLDQGKTVKEIAQALDDVTWSYAWDVAAAWEKKTGKVVIASHRKAPRVRASRKTQAAK